jgi:DNA ligase-1
VKEFADLLERLLFAPGRNTKIALLQNYFASRPDPERGYALAAIAGALSIPGAKPAALKAMTEARTDPVLFALSYDFVGDLAETIALIWPGSGSKNPPELPNVIATLQQASKPSIPGIIATWLDQSDPSVRIALIKLLTGGLRVGASLRLAHLALAAWGGVDVNEIEGVWHGLEPPYTPLFAWLAGGDKPVSGEKPVFRPVMLAHPTSLGQ